MEAERIATWWVKWADLSWPNTDGLDLIRRRADGFKEASVSAAMIFGAHFRWDFLPMFTQLHDYIATVAEELHRRGIKLYDHHSATLTHRYHTKEELRHIMLDSAPHLPFCPSFEAAESWCYKGRRLNDWRMRDVRTGEPAFLKQYMAESFCHRNPEFAETYADYVRTLIKDTGIDGLSADDAIHLGGYTTCGCEYCRAELRRRSGTELPPADDMSFWGNWDNPAWLSWIDLRFDAAGSFYEKLKAELPKGFMLTGCGGTSASGYSVAAATDARQFSRGCNYINMELVGNTPPYKHDPLTVNVPVRQRFTNVSHHRAVAREHGIRFFNTGFAHSKVSADCVWAICKALGGDAWIGTLKGRLGLPDHILEKLPNEEDITAAAFGFEKAHPELFKGELLAQAGVYFSYETRDHTMFGSLFEGYCSDYNETLALLFRNGICADTLFSFPENADRYPVILLPSAVKMRPEEMNAMDRYLAKGGKVIATGPSAFGECKNGYTLPTRVNVPANEFFPSVPDGIHLRQPDWLRIKLPDSTDRDEWLEPREGMYYHPGRASEGKNGGGLVELCRSLTKPLPAEVLAAGGFLTAAFQNGEHCIIHLLAEEYDMDIDHELDSMRTHRSRVNYITKAEPVGTDGEVRIKTDMMLEVYTPFCAGPVQTEYADGVYTLYLPKDCMYAILHLKNRAGM